MLSRFLIPIFTLSSFIWTVLIIIRCPYLTAGIFDIEQYFFKTLWQKLFNIAINFNSQHVSSFISPVSSFIEWYHITENTISIEECKIMIPSQVELNRTLALPCPVLTMLYLPGFLFLWILIKNLFFSKTFLLMLWTSLFFENKIMTPYQFFGSEKGINTDIRINLKLFLVKINFNFCIFTFKCSIISMENYNFKIFSIEDNAEKHEKNE